MYVCKSISNINWTEVPLLGSSTRFPTNVPSIYYVNVLNNKIICNPTRFQQTSQFDVNTTNNIYAIPEPVAWTGLTTPSGPTPLAFVGNSAVVVSGRTSTGTSFPCSISRTSDTEWVNAGPVLPSSNHRSLVCGRSDGWIISCGGGSSAINDSITAVSDVFVSKYENKTLSMWSKIGSAPVALKLGSVIFDMNGDITVLGGSPNGVSLTDFANLNRQVWRAKFLP